MHIQSSRLVFLSAREYQEKITHEKRLHVWKDASRENADGIAGKVRSAASRVAPSPEKCPGASPEEGVSLDPKLQAIKRVLEALTGRKIEVADIGRFRHDTGEVPARPAGQESGQAGESQRAGWGIDYRETRSLSEKEKSAVMVAGTVKTGKGDEINFSLHLAMKREFTSHKEMSFKAGDALIDPLVVNLDSAPARLADSTFRFDLNADGRDETLSWLDGSSGFLVFDRNSDNNVNSGRELFGPRTGQGFQELESLDADGNGWIDENDPGFARLKVWTGDTHETASLETLEKKGIGALSLAAIESRFSLKDQANTTLGRVRKTGVYLTEKGGAGTVQEIDLAL